MSFKDEGQNLKFTIKTVLKYFFLLHVVIIITVWFYLSHLSKKSELMEFRTELTFHPSSAEVEGEIDDLIIYAASLRRQIHRKVGSLRFYISEIITSVQISIGVVVL